MDADAGWRGLVLTDNAAVEVRCVAEPSNWWHASKAAWNARSGRARLEPDRQHVTADLATPPDVASRSTITTGVAAPAPASPAEPGTGSASRRCTTRTPPAGSADRTASRRPPTRQHGRPRSPDPCTSGAGSGTDSRHRPEPVCGPPATPSSGTRATSAVWIHRDGSKVRTPKTRKVLSRERLRRGRSAPLSVMAAPPYPPVSPGLWVAHRLVNRPAPLL